MEVKNEIWRLNRGEFENYFDWTRTFLWGEKYILPSFQINNDSDLFINPSDVEIIFPFSFPHTFYEWFTVDVILLHLKLLSSLDLNNGNRK
jgi:hypothetical protein